MQKLSILVVDDHPVVHLGLGMVIKAENGFTVCGAAATVEEARELSSRLQPDIIVLDLILDGRDGVSLIRELRNFAPSTRIIVYSTLDEMRYAHRAFRAGAVGYVMKTLGLDVVAAALKVVARGGYYASPAVQHEAFRTHITGGKSLACQSLDVLSDREMDVFRMIGEGMGSTQIADRLHLSRKTVSTYRERVKIKLALPTRRELEKYAEEFFLSGQYLALSDSHPAGHS